MKLQVFSLFCALTLLVSACGGAPAPNTPYPVDMQGTANVIAVTLLAQTEAARPTHTMSPTNTLEPTATAIPTETPVPTFTVTPTATEAIACNQPLTSWQGESASFTVVNETKPKGKVTLMMSVLTPLGECGWLNIYSDSFSGPVGSYSAGAFVDGTKDFRVFGAFQIQKGGWKIVVRNDAIVALGGCYPNC